MQALVHSGHCGQVQDGTPAEILQQARGNGDTPEIFRISQKLQRGVNEAQVKQHIIDDTVAIQQRNKQTAEDNPGQKMR
ncbi:hypothetical protein D3C80_2032060 [compost metagenome]